MGDNTHRDPTPAGPHVWIQWKGTNACVDIHCACGRMGHLDDTFLYYIKCNGCGRIYAVGQNVPLFELTPEEIKNEDPNPKRFDAEDP